MIGECYLLRAYMHFLLVNLYGQPYTRPGALETKAVPLKLNSDINEILRKIPLHRFTRLYFRISMKLKKLINKESWEQKFSYRFTTLSVKALRARVYLYMGQWENAYKAAEAVLTEKNTLEDFNDEAFILPNNYQSVENITALERGMSSNYTQAAVLSEALASSYGEGDLRLDA